MLRVRSFDMVTPRRNPFISGTKSLIKRANNVGANVSPWRTPAVCANQSAMLPFTLTQLCKLLYIVGMIESICPCTPAVDTSCVIMHTIKSLFVIYEYTECWQFLCFRVTNDSCEGPPQKGTMYTFVSHNDVRMRYYNDNNLHNGSYPL